MSKDKVTTTLWEDYRNGLAYQETSGLAKKLPKFVKFFEGDQWAKPTKNTKNLPRPVVNIVKMICRNKKSAILSTPVKLVYKADDEMVDCERFNRFSDYIQKEIGQDKLDKLAIDDGVKKGSYFYHYYWDSEAKGKDGIKEGGLRCEIIDPLNIFFANPIELDEQKQKWIIISSREDIDSVKAKADKDVDLDAIVGDESDDDKYGAVEQDGEKLVTVLTRYFRKNGEVYCEKATKSIVLNKPFPITPNVGEAQRLIEEDAPNNSLPDKTTDESDIAPNPERAYLYPIVVGNYEKREKSIYGLGEVEGIIPNQKAINFNIAMALLNDQETAWSKYVVHPKALRGQTITNEPGQVIFDYSETGKGIQRLSGSSMTSSLNVIDTLTSLTRVVTGSTEVMTGETLGAGMSGAAIAQLQSQAQQPVEELRNTFWLVKEKQGKVLAQFFKLFYAAKEFTYTEERPRTDNMGNIIPNAPMEEVQLTDEFYSNDYIGIDFSVVVETCVGTNSSAAGDINALDTLMAKGLISLKTYLKAYPKDALANKEELLKGIEADDQDQIKALSAQLEQATAQAQQMAEQLKAQEQAFNGVQSIITENQKLKQMLAQLYAEAAQKIKQSNKQIMMNNQKLAETTADATRFAEIIDNELKNSQGN